MRIRLIALTICPLFSTALLIGFVGIAAVASEHRGSSTSLALQASSSPTERVLANFNADDGAYPETGLNMDQQGALYGTAVAGGTAGVGTLFQLTRSGSAWNITTLHDFGTTATDGEAPMAPVTFGKHGELFGTTQNGGALCHALNCIGGTVYEMNRDQEGKWREHVIASFTAANGHGDAPNGPVLIDDSGSLYGTAELVGQGGCGLVFRLTPARSGRWTFTTLHAFTGGSTDGCFPTGPLLRDRSGALYGTTIEGGLSSIGFSYGVVYRLSPPLEATGQWTETILYEFQGPYIDNDGAQPWEGVVADSTGALYGTTHEGGDTTTCTLGCGTVFKLTPSRSMTERWSENVIHRFVGANGDGVSPYAGLTLGRGGVLYGATASGGALNGNCKIGCGTIFRFEPAHNDPNRYVERVLYSFVGGNDGVEPFLETLLLSDGTLYGTTVGGAPPAPSIRMDAGPSSR